jgi:hypothetical protein
MTSHQSEVYVVHRIFVALKIFPNKWIVVSQQFVDPVIIKLGMAELSGPLKNVIFPGLINSSVFCANHLKF